jgi:hypothetical protein
MTEQQEQELTQLQALRAELTATKKKVLQLQQQIKELEEDIYSKCKHEWKIDYTNVGEHTEYICTKCGGFRGGSAPQRRDYGGFRPPTTGTSLDNPTA